MNIAIFARDLGAVGHLRLLDPLQFLRHEVRYAFTEIRPGVVALQSGVVEWADVLVVQRDFPGPDLAPLCQSLLASGKPTVYETDDIVWAIDTRAAREARPYITAFIAAAQWVTVSTQALARQVLPINPRVTVLPNALNDALWAPHTIDPLKRRTRRVRIGYAGMPDHFHDINDLRPVLLKLAATYRQVDLCFMGCQPNAMDEVRRASFTPADPDYSLFPSRLAAMNLDIGLAPLRDTPLNQCRSPVKYFDYALTGAVTVATRGTVFDEVIHQGENGFLCSTPDEWFTVLSGLIEDAGLRKRIAKNAQTDVHTHWMLSRNAHLWGAIYHPLVPR